MSLLHNFRAHKLHESTWLRRLRCFTSNLKFISEANMHHTKVIISIQWLRAISAAMVVVLHPIYYYNIGVGLGIGAPLRLFGFENWGYGVNIFFLISGFVMVTSVNSFSEPGAWKQFLVRRIIRIAPLYWVVSSIFVIITLLIPSQHKIDGDIFAYILKSYLFIPALRSADDLRPILGQGWSLNYEMFFYVMFAVSMVFSKRLAVVFLTLVFGFFYWEGRELTVSSPILFTWCNGLIFQFLWGVYVGLAFQAGLRVTRLVALGAIIAGFGLLFIEFNGANAFVAGVPAILILIGCTLGPQFNATKITQWLVHIGNASYSLYLTHTLFIRPLWSVWAFLGCANWHPGAFAAFSLAVTVTAALAVYHYIEIPLLAALRGLGSGASALNTRVAL